MYFMAIEFPRFIIFPHFSQSLQVYACILQPRGACMILRDKL